MITSERSVADSLPGRINQGAVVLAASTVLLVAAGVGFGSFAFISGAVILASIYAVANLVKGPSCFRKVPDSRGDGAGRWE